jgi:hypothetical protein
MRKSLVGAVAVSVWAVWAGGAAHAARADQIHLVGGTQLEGKATRHGDKVVVEMESGEITLSADGVERIERARGSVERYQELAGKLRPNDVAARMALADFCRDHDMQAREKELLRQVIELEPNQEQARARLGYVKTSAGWITRDEQMRAQGYVREAGQWLSPERALELQRLRAQSEAATTERDKARVELEQKRLELQQRKQELEAEAARGSTHDDVTPPIVYPYGVVGYGATYGYGVGSRAYRDPVGTSVPAARPFPINGVRDPRSSGWPLNGVRDPRSY